MLRTARMLLVVSLAAVAATAITTPDARPTAGPGFELTITPQAGKRHDRFTVAITSRHRTGVVGKTLRSYFAEAHAAHPASGCVNNRDRRFATGVAGSRIRATLDPARGEGGHLGWCRGLVRGTVTYNEDFACPASGTCTRPPGFPHRLRVVARFSFRVR